MSEKKVNIGVVGATGYTGSELLRLLLLHPRATIKVVTSRSDAGVALSDYWPNLSGHCDLAFVEPDAKQLIEQCDVVFFATPHAVAMHMIPELLEGGVKVIDLSADFRIKDIGLWEQWYGVKHACPDYVAEAVYALPELFREEIPKARLLACPGCYPTAIQLGFAPLLKNQLVDKDSLIANAASGVSGAGRQAKIPGLFSELSDNFKAYAVAGHRHLPEINQTLTQVSGDSTMITFVPHLLPIIRGIHATLYCKPHDMSVDFQALFEAFYRDELFVEVLPQGVLPETRSVKGTNVCRIAVQKIETSNTLAILSVEDNLTKGAAGQAVQAMNILLGFAEDEGLKHIALMP